MRFNSDSPEYAFDFGGHEALDTEADGEPLDGLAQSALVSVGPFPRMEAGDTISVTVALGVWPIIMGITMWLQMRLNPTPPDPIQASLFNWMPVIFTFMLGTFPAGLVIYWTWNNFLSVAQQGLIMRKAGVKIELWDNLSKLFAKK